MHQQDLLQWSRRLRALSEHTLGKILKPENPADFRDERGNGRDVDRLLVEWGHRGVRSSAPRSVGKHQLPLTTASGYPPEVRLWLALLDSSVPIEPALAPVPGSRPRECFPLVAQPAHTSIEVWTEVELSGLHAFWWHAHLRREPTRRNRLGASVCYLTANIQPDNATQHAWGVHVFLLDWLEHKRVESRMFAETLIHACQLQHGRPDLVSAYALMDSAVALDMLGKKVTEGGS